MRTIIIIAVSVMCIVRIGHAESLFELAASGSVPDLTNALATAYGDEYDVVAVVNDVRDSSGWSLMHRAAENNNVPVLTYFLTAGVMPDLGAGPVMATPLHVGIRGGATNAVIALLDHEASLSIADNNARTPLEWAYLRRNLGILELLLQRGADPNEPFWRTPRMILQLDGNVTPLSEQIIALFDTHGFDEEYHRSLMLPSPEHVDEAILDQLFEDTAD